MNIKKMILLTSLIVSAQSLAHATNINIGVRIIRGDEIKVDKTETINIDVTSNIEKTLLDKLCPELLKLQTNKSRVEVSNANYRLLVVDQKDTDWFMTYRFPGCNLSFKDVQDFFAKKHNTSPNAMTFTIVHCDTPFNQNLNKCLGEGIVRVEFVAFPCSECCIFECCNYDYHHPVKPTPANTAASAATAVNNKPVTTTMVRVQPNDSKSHEKTN